MRILLLAALLLASVAHAGDARLSWSAPTQRVDGTALDNLAGYRVLWGTTSRAYTQQQVINSPATLTYFIDGLAAGTWYFAVTAFDAAGLESAYSAEVSKVIVQAAPPIPPGGTVVAGTGPRPVYVITQANGRLTLVPVGTVPPETPCDAQAVRDSNGLTAYLVPEDAVTWAGSVRRSVVLAECE